MPESTSGFENRPSSATGRSSIGLNAWPPEANRVLREDGMIDCKVETESLADETRVVSVAGELDMYTVPPFQEQIGAALNNGHGRIVIDLSACWFIDSTAVGILITANKHLGEQNDRLVLVAADRNVVKVFEITGLDRVFTIVPTRASALNGATRD
jgi:anti-sigma B factor antagonist